MGKINVFETEYEQAVRERAEKVQRVYLSHAHEILSGQIKPNRIIQKIANDEGMSGEGIKSILKRYGIYKSSSQPVIFSGTGTPKQMSLNF